MAGTRVLLLGGHGKVALLMTPHLLKRSWQVTSVIRNPDHKDEILKLDQDKTGRLDVLVESLEDVKSPEQAARILEQVKPNYVIWSAGAGGKGGADRTFAIDRDAAKHYITASLENPSVTKFLMVSYLGSRRHRAPWWSDEDAALSERVNKTVLANYYEAKLAADEHLATLAKKRADGGDTAFQAICLRPGTLKDEPASGKVDLGKIKPGGGVSRADVGDIVARLLERDDTRGWIDMLSGDEPIDEAIERIVREKVDCMDGE